MSLGQQWNIYKCNPDGYWIQSKIKVACYSKFLNAIQLEKFKIFSFTQFQGSCAKFIETLLYLGIIYNLELFFTHLS